MFFNNFSDWKLNAWSCWSDFSLRIYRKRRKSAKDALDDDLTTLRNFLIPIRFLKRNFLQSTLIFLSSLRKIICDCDVKLTEWNLQKLIWKLSEKIVVEYFCFVIQLRWLTSNNWRLASGCSSPIKSRPLTILKSFLLFQTISIVISLHYL